MRINILTNFLLVRFSTGRSAANFFLLLLVVPFVRLTHHFAADENLTVENARFFRP